MSHFHPSSFLRRSLILDTVASGATGALMLVGAGLLESWLGLPAALMRAAGLVLVPYVAFVGYLATRDTLTPAAVWTVIAANALWAVASVGLLADLWWRRCNLDLLVFADPRGMLVAPGALHQNPAGTAVAGLGDRAALDGVAGGVSDGTRPR